MAILGLLLGGLWASGAAAEGRYERRRAKRGETTDTSAKLGAQAFINDLEVGDRRLAAFVDAAGFRDPLVPELVPIRVGVSYRGQGSRLPIGPRSFRLSGEGLESPLVPLSQEELVGRPRGRAAIEHAGRASAVRHAPQPFGPDDGLRIPTRFHADPSRSAWWQEESELLPGTWFTDLLFVELPEGFSPWGPLLTLSLLDASGAGEALIEVRFRVEEDPELHRLAFRRAKKARKKEDKAARKEEKRARRERERSEREAEGDAPSR